MSMSIPMFIVLVVALLVAGVLLHHYAGRFASGEAKAKAGLQALETAAVNEGHALLAKAELWLTDEAGVLEKRAKAAALMAEANAEEAARRAALALHIATLQAKLPAAASA